MLSKLIAQRVAQRFAKRYEPVKETKLNRIDRMFRQIRERTGLSRSLSEAIADAFVRGRDVAGLAIQKGWPIDGGVILGPEGDLEVAALAEM